MVDGEVELVKIVQILPEFHEGGVERHVLWLSNELVEKGHDVLVVSGGGKLEQQLDPRVQTLHLPVHRKNPLTGAWAAFRLASKVRREGWQILHAHSRVPAWIAWWTSVLSHKPWIVTAHAEYSLNAGIFPFRKASGAICVSQSVRNYLEGYLPERTEVILNGLPPTDLKWEGSGDPDRTHFLFVGRLTPLKGLMTVLQALAELPEATWGLDVLGDGPQRGELERFATESGLGDKVTFHGFRDDARQWMAHADCLLFPSRTEGMPLVLMEAVQMGMRVLSADIPSVRCLGIDGSFLIHPGSVQGWRASLGRVLAEGVPEVPNLRVRSSLDQAEETARFLANSVTNTGTN